jgi:hypothetical protein
MPTWVYRVANKYGLDTQLEYPIKKYPIYAEMCVGPQKESNMSWLIHANQIYYICGYGQNDPSYTIQ